MPSLMTDKIHEHFLNTLAVGGSVATTLAVSAGIIASEVAAGIEPTTVFATAPLAGMIGIRVGQGVMDAYENYKRKFYKEDIKKSNFEKISKEYPSLTIEKSRYKQMKRNWDNLNEYEIKHERKYQVLLLYVNTPDMYQFSFPKENKISFCVSKDADVKLYVVKRDKKHLAFEAKAGDRENLNFIINCFESFDYDKANKVAEQRESVVNDKEIKQQRVREMEERAKNIQKIQIEYEQSAGNALQK